MKLGRCGMPGDHGIDLRGTWDIPGLPKEDLNSSGIPIIVSCKAHKITSGPVQIRELEGALGSSSQDTIGILATVSSCTRGAISQMLLSRRPLAYCYVKPYADGGQLQQFVWNSAAGILLQGLEAKMRYSVGKGEEIKGEMVLTFNGKALSKNARKPKEI